MMMVIVVYRHFSACKWAESNLQRYWGEVKDETPFRYSHDEIRTQVAVMCDPTRCQLDRKEHGQIRKPSNLCLLAIRLDLLV